MPTPSSIATTASVRSSSARPRCRTATQASCGGGHDEEERRRTTRRERREPAATSTIGAVDPRPVGVFDSGVGGLTVLHECLVTMPHEDFVYLGDHARLPYGPRPLAEIRRFAREIGRYLEGQGVKLIVVACNAATSAALPRLQEELEVPVVGVITPEAHAAVQATRNRRVGLLATEATVRAGRYARARAHARRGRPLLPDRVPAARAADRERRLRRRGDGRRPCASTRRRCRPTASTP